MAQLGTNLYQVLSRCCTGTAIAIGGGGGGGCGLDAGVELAGCGLRVEVEFGGWDAELDPHPNPETQPTKADN